MPAPDPIRESEEFQELLEIVGTYADLQGAQGVLGWDQETYMPPGGASLRARQIGTLSKLAHEIFIRPRVGELVARLWDRAQSLPHDSFEASLLRKVKRDWELAARVPPSLIGEITEAASLATGTWVEAREENHFATFEPHLGRLVGLVRRLVDHLGYTEHPYDALLDQYEPGMKLSDVQPIFDTLREGLVPLVRAIVSRSDRVDDAILHKGYPEAGQWELSMEALGVIGYDLRCGRLDRSPHPFTRGFGRTDVRVTTRFDPDDVSSALYSSLHEGGHALYEQGVPEEFDRTPLAEGASLGVHESQSRMWENVVGRSLAFWQFFLPKARAVFPEQLRDATPETMYRAVNRVRPSEIRTEADEVTYNLHIFLRLELEVGILEGRLTPADLPEAWNAGMERYLGIRPRDDAHGVLQDIHWAHASFGYFPTYTLGNILSVLFYDQACRERPEIPDAIREGRFGELLGWLREHVHAHGAKFTPKELVERITGRTITAEPYLAYLRRKYGELYGIAL